MPQPNESKSTLKAILIIGAVAVAVALSIWNSATPRKETAMSKAQALEQELVMKCGIGQCVEADLAINGSTAEMFVEVDKRGAFHATNKRKGVYKMAPKTAMWSCMDTGRWAALCGR